MANVVTEAARKAAEERAKKRAEALRANLKRRKTAENEKGERDAKPENSE